MNSIQQPLYHGMTGSDIGKFHIDMIQKVMSEIKNHIGKFTAYHKDTAYKTEDFVTTADYAAQDIYASMIQNNLPNAGILAEENNLSISPNNTESILYTIDPVDGTGALVRRQSDGIGTLLGVVDTAKKSIIASYIGDIMTGELYYYHPGDPTVYRQYGVEEKLSYKERERKRILTLDDVRDYPSRADQITRSDGYWSSIDISNGSIGTNMAKLRKGEIDAVLLKPGLSQPWDRIPCAGIGEQLGYTTIAIDDAQRIAKVVDMNQSWMLTEMKVPFQLIVHHKELVQVLDQLKQSGINIS